MPAASLAHRTRSAPQARPAPTRRTFLATLAGCAAALFVTAGLLTSCGKDTPLAGPPRPLVVCSIFSYYDAARAIGANAIEAKLLLPAQTSPHEYRGAPSDKVTAAKAALYINNGMGLDDHLDKLFEDSHAKILTISKVIPPELILKTKEVSLDGPASASAPASAPAAPAASDDATLPNPHIWLDPLVQIKAAEKIRDALIDLDPKNKTVYEANARAYMADIYGLDRDFKEAVPTFKTKEFIGFHSAYEYLARRYGLKQIASVEELPGTPLSPAQLGKIVRLIQDHHIHYIAIETGLTPQGIDAIKRETGVNTFVLQPLETYDDISDTYLSLMQKNLESLKKALSGP